MAAFPDRVINLLAKTRMKKTYYTSTPTSCFFAHFSCRCRFNSPFRIPNHADSRDLRSRGRGLCAGERSSQMEGLVALGENGPEREGGPRRSSRRNRRQNELVRQ